MCGEVENFTTRQRLWSLTNSLLKLLKSTELGRSYIPPKLARFFSHSVLSSFECVWLSLCAFQWNQRFCEMLKIMKFCAIALCTCTGNWTSCTCTCTCTLWHSTCYKTAHAPTKGQQPQRSHNTIWLALTKFRTRNLGKRHVRTADHATAT